MGKQDCEPEAQEALGQIKDGTINHADNDLLTHRPVSPRRILSASKIKLLAWTDNMAIAQDLLVNNFCYRSHSSDIVRSKSSLLTHVVPFALSLPLSSQNALKVVKSSL